MINVSELITDPDFAQSFTVTRYLGAWVDGRLQEQKSEIPMMGVITPENTSDMNQLPGGDTITGRINIYSLEPLFTTRLQGDNSSRSSTSDEIEWRGEKWKILQTENFLDFGYFKSLAVRKFGA